MIRALLILVIVLAACTVPPMAENKTETADIPSTSIPESAAIETAPKKDPPVKHRRTIPKPAAKPIEPEPANPVADCLNLGISDPTKAARAKLDCMLKVNE